MMNLPETPFSTWTRTDNYAKGSMSQGSLVVTDKFTCATEDFDLEKLAECYKLAYEGLIVSDANYEPNENASRMTVTLTYTRPTSESLSLATDGVPEYSCEDSGVEVPLDKRKKDGSLWFPNYKTNWLYVLAAKKGVTQSPSWWATVTVTEMEPGDPDAEKYKWYKDSSDVPEGWYVLKDKTKNAETALIPSPVVVETIKYSSYNSAVAKKSIVGTKKTPGKTFGESGEWLVVSSSVYQDGKKWCCQTRYQNAPEWDADFIIRG